MDTVDTNNSRRGRWTKAEHERFLVALEYFSSIENAFSGSKWRLVAEMVMTRSIVQCKTHHQKYELNQLKQRQAQQLLKSYTTEEEPNCINAETQTRMIAEINVQTASKLSIEEGFYHFLSLAEPKSPNVSQEKPEKISTNDEFWPSSDDEFIKETPALPEDETLITNLA